MTRPTKQRPATHPVPAWLQAALGLALAAGLAGCGGGGPNDAERTPTAAVTGPGSSLPPVGAQTGADAPAMTAEQAATPVEPTYHLAPVLPGAPSAVDADGSSTSARQLPRQVGVPASAQALSTRALTLGQLVNGTTDRQALGANPSPSLTTNKVTVTYTPAQIRAAYGLPPVPSNLAGLTALQAAQLGAGQTIYVVDAFHSLYAYGELLAFSQLFGLPPCTSKTLAATAALPLPAPSTTACEFYQVFSGASGTLSATAPRFDEKWAIEIAMDIQWAHAIAPLARIVLIEAAADSLAGISSAIQLANRMGPGVVSMSFAAPEGGLVAPNDNLFQTKGMSYFASTGDNGTAVNWPAASSNVVAVGGTSLTYSGTGARSETAWSLAGGGISASVVAPAYQNASLLKLAANSRRSVADVSMNADPGTGQFIAVIPNAQTCTFCQVSWVTSGGTSLSTPQWAGLAAVANALRTQAGKALLGAPHALLYKPLATSATAYASAYLDVVKGANGSCATCTAKAGYDGPTGLGSPNGLSLLATLTESTAAPVAPAVIATTVNGAYGQALSFTPSVSSSHAYSLSLSGAPAGMVLANGVVSWPSPIAGSFAVKLTAKDLTTGLSGQGTVTVVVAAPPPPIMSNGSLTAVAAQALSFTVAAGDRYPAKLSLVSAPAGVTLSAGSMNAATVAWAKPVVGVHKVVVKAVSQQTGLSAQGTYTLAVNPASAPQVAAGQVAGRPNVPLSVTVAVAAANPTTLSLVGAPAGLAIDAAGKLSWSKPVAGDYAVTVQAKDSKTGLVGAGVVNISIGASAAPAIMTTVMSGVAGKPFSATISITTGDAQLVGVSFGGGPNGLKFDTQGGMGTTLVSWPTPVAGTYTVQVSATNSAGQSAIALVPLVIAAK